MRCPVLPLSKSNKKCFGYFDPEKMFQIMKMNNFRGEITDVSDKKEALAVLLYTNLLHPIKFEACPSLAPPKMFYISNC